MKKVVLISLICIQYVYADDPLNPFPNIDGHWFWKISGLVAIITTTCGMAVNSIKQYLIGFLLLIASAEMCLDSDLCGYITLIMAFLILIIPNKYMKYLKRTIKK